MVHKEYLLKMLRTPRVSEKVSTAMEKSSTIVLKVAKNVTKAEVKATIQKLSKVEVGIVSALVVRGGVKRHGRRVGHRSGWEKAYAALKEGQNLDFVGGTG